MRLKKYAATAVFAIASLGIAAGTAQAQPAGAPQHNPNKMEMLSADGARIAAEFANGAVTFTGANFAVVGDKLRVTQGDKVTDLPLTFENGRSLVAATGTDGKSATVRAGQHVAGKATNINGAQWFSYELNRAAPGALVGAIVGGIIGIFFFGIGVIPGALIGAAAGLLIAGGQPLIDAGFAYFQGR